MTLPGPKRGKNPDRQHLGNCVRCRHGIYTGDTHHRARGQWLGLLCHDCHHILGLTGATR